MNKPCMFAMALMLAAPAAVFAQQHSGGSDQVTQESARNIAANLQRMSQHNFDSMSHADHQSWLESMAADAKLRVKLTESWQSLGLSPQAAEQVARAYDPVLGANAHHTSLRGKSEQEVASLLQTALADKRYQKANQMLIDYERQKLSLDPMSAVTGAD